MTIAIKRDTENTRELLNAALSERFPSGGDLWVATFDPDDLWVIYQVFGEMRGSEHFRLSYEDDGTDVTLSTDQPTAVSRETETNWVEKGGQRGELTGPIVFKNSAQQIAYAAVLVPGEEDSDGEVLTAAKIEEVAHGWMEKYRNIDLQHSLNNIDALPVESHILRQSEEVSIGAEKQTLPVGSWVLASKFNDAQTWKGIESGKFGGYSVMGVQRAVVKAAVKSSTALAPHAYKKTLLEDLGEDWIGTHVSVVDEPAVPKAKWFALKSARPSRKQRFKELFSAKEGRRFSATTLTTLRSAKEALDALIGEAEKERATKQSGNGNSGGGGSKVAEDIGAAYVKSVVKSSMKDSNEKGND